MDAHDPESREALPESRGQGQRRFTFSAEPRRVGVGPSRVVRSLKLILPATAAVVITLLIAWPQLQDSAPGSDSLKVRTDEAEDLRMRNARYVGTDSSNRPFTVIAEATRQVGSDTRRLDLEKPQADITLGDGAWVAVVANRGRYDREANQLALSGDVQLFHDQGYHVRSEGAHLDLRSGIASGDRPVTAQGPAGILKGEGFRIEQDGQRVMLTGRAHLELHPAGLKKQTSEKRP